MKLYHYLENRIINDSIQLNIEENIFDFVDLAYILKSGILSLENIFKKNKINHENKFKMSFKLKNNIKDREEDLFYKKNEEDKEDKKNIDDFLNESIEIFNDFFKLQQIKPNHNDILKKQILELIKEYIRYNYRSDYFSSYFYRNAYIDLPFTNFEYKKEILLKDIIFNFTHDYFFHATSEFDVFKKFGKPIYGDFDNPHGYNPIEIFKEFNASYSNYIISKIEKEDSDERIERNIKNDIKYIFGNIKKSLVSSEKHINKSIWGRFREFFNGYDTLLNLIPKNKYPDNQEMNLDEELIDKIFNAFLKSKNLFHKQSKEQNLPGFSKNENTILKRTQKPHDEKIQKFQTVQKALLRELSNIIRKCGNNQKYLSMLN